MADATIVASVLSLGVGGVLAIVIFLCYRQDRNKSEDRLSGLLKQDQKSRESNTEALTELVTLIKKLNGKWSSS
jgi:cell division protein ZapA (FtsZ GTPase activity inhibitor)